MKSWSVVDCTCDKTLVIIIGNGWGWPEFKSWTRLFAFFITLILLGKYESSYSPSRYGKIFGLTGIFNFVVSPVGWGCWICQLHLCWRVSLLSKECPVYDTKQSDGEVQVMLGLWVMWSTPSLPLLPDPLWSGVLAPDRVLSMGQIKLRYLDWVQTNDFC